MIYCPNHVHKLAKRRGLCGSCYTKLLKVENKGYAQRQADSTKQYRKNNAIKIKKTRDRWYNDNQDCALASSTRNWNKLTKEERWAKNIKQSYGLTPDMYYAMLLTQAGVCMICKDPPDLNLKRGGGKLRVDHNHTTGEVRGLLCHKCNWFIGWIDNYGVDYVMKGIAYASRKSVTTKTLRDSQE